MFQPRGVAVSSASSVLFPFGSPNTLGVGSLCYVSFAMIAPHVTMGGMLITMFSDLEQAGLIVVWGANPATDCPPLDLKRIMAARERGAELIVIDPRRTRTAKLPGAEWVTIRSGHGRRARPGHVQRRLSGKSCTTRPLCGTGRTGSTSSPGMCSITRRRWSSRSPEFRRRRSCPSRRRIAAAQGASPVMYSGLEYSESGVQAIRATQVLWALAGQLDVPGGRCFSMRENSFA